MVKDRVWLSFDILGVSGEETRVLRSGVWRKRMNLVMGFSLLFREEGRGCGVLCV